MTDDDTLDAVEAAIEAARDYSYDIAVKAAEILNKMPHTVALPTGQEEWRAMYFGREGSSLRRVYFSPDAVVDGDVIEPGWSWAASVFDEEEAGWYFTSSSGNRGNRTAEQIAEEIAELLGINDIKSLLTERSENP